MLTPIAVGTLFALRDRSADGRRRANSRRTGLGRCGLRAFRLIFSPAPREVILGREALRGGTWWDGSIVLPCRRVSVSLSDSPRSSEWDGRNVGTSSGCADWYGRALSDGRVPADKHGTVSRHGRKPGCLLLIVIPRAQAAVIASALRREDVKNRAAPPQMPSAVVLPDPLVEAGPFPLGAGLWVWAGAPRLLSHDPSGSRLIGFCFDAFETGPGPWPWR